MTKETLWSLTCVNHGKHIPIGIYACWQNAFDQMIAYIFHDLLIDLEAALFETNRQDCQRPYWPDTFKDLRQLLQHPYRYLGIPTEESDGRIVKMWSRQDPETILKTSSGLEYILCPVPLYIGTCGPK